jgi:hypothetical protein
MKPSTYVVLIGAILMIIGAIMPWASVMGIGVSGLEGDGWFCLIAGVIAGVFAFLKLNWGKWIVVLMGLVGAVVGIIDYMKIKDAVAATGAMAEAGMGISIGIGMYLVIVGGIVALIGGFITKKATAGPAA